MMVITDLSAPAAPAEPTTPTAELTLETLARHLDRLSPQLNAIGQGLATLEERFMLVTLFQQKEQLRTMILVMWAVMAEAAGLPETADVSRDLSDEMWKAHKNKHPAFYAVTRKEFFGDCARVLEMCDGVGLLSNKDGMDAVVKRINKWSETVCGEGFANRFTLPKNVVRQSR